MSFDSIAGRQKIIKNEEWLNVEWIPPKLRYRDADIDEIETYLGSIANKATPQNILITGRTGVGKTAMMSFIKKDIKQWCEKEGNDSKLIRIDCATYSTEFQVLSDIYKKMSPTKKDNVPKGLGSTGLYEKIEECMSDIDGVVVLVLDEIDKYISNPSNPHKYRLLRKIPRRPNFDDISKMSAIYITNKANCFKNIPADVESSMNTVVKHIRPYNAMELTDILSERLEHALSDEAKERKIVSRGMINYIAATLKNEHFDVRKALTILRISLNYYIEGKTDQITQETIMSARERLYVESINNTLRALEPIHNHTILYTLAYLDDEDGSKWHETLDIYSLYKTFCERVMQKPVSKRMVFIYLSELELEGIIESSLEYRGRAKGRTREWHLTERDAVLNISFKKLKEEYEGYMFNIKMGMPVRKQPKFTAPTETEQNILQ